MSSLTQLKRIGYSQQRACSHGAQITLVAGYGYYSALFECATYVASVLGERGLSDVGDGIMEIIPSYRIATEDVFEVLGKLAKKFSIALVEYNCSGKDGGHFVCVWRIERTKAGLGTVEELMRQPSFNADDY